MGTQGLLPAFDVRSPEVRTLGENIKPVTIVSADSHAMPTAEQYVEYLDPKYRTHAAEYFALIDQYHELFSLFGYPLPPELLEKTDRNGLMRSGGEVGSYDPARRLREVEADGIVAEILHPDGPVAMGPFVNWLSPVVSPELRAAGCRAHNRFLDEFCSIAPERLIGAHLIYPWPDMAAAVADCERARSAGARAIYPPMQAGAENDVSPPFYDPCYDPLWAACQDLGLVVHIHAGWGNPQGSLPWLLEFSRTAIEAGDTTALAEVLDTFIERRPLWQLMWGGVFDRFPGLKVAFVEVHCDWVPGTLAFLETVADEQRGSMKLRPTEYWRRHCGAVASVARYGDVAVRHEVGLERFMFGSDFPHMESTWPNTADWIHEMLGGLNEDELRKVLGENAIEFYGLDRAVLEREAFRIGPLVSDLLSPDHIVDPVLVDHFNNMSGTRKPANLHQQRLEDTVAKDVAGALRVVNV